MAIKTQVNAILKKRMDRQDFIKHLAIGMVAVSGIGTALKFLAPKQDKPAAAGYGNSAYGGGNESKKVG